MARVFSQYGRFPENRVGDKGTTGRMGRFAAPGGPGRLRARGQGRPGLQKRLEARDQTAGHPWLTPSSTPLPGTKPSWTTVSLTTPGPASSMSKATLERGSAPPGGDPDLLIASVRPPPTRPRTCARCRPAGGRGRTPGSTCSGKRDGQPDLVVDGVVGRALLPVRSAASGPPETGCAPVPGGEVGVGEPEPDTLGGGFDVGVVDECRRVPPAPGGASSAVLSSDRALARARS